MPARPLKNRIMKTTHFIWLLDGRFARMLEVEDDLGTLELGKVTNMVLLKTTHWRISGISIRFQWCLKMDGSRSSL